MSTKLHFYEVVSTPARFFFHSHWNFGLRAKETEKSYDSVPFCASLDSDAQKGLEYFENCSNNFSFYTSVAVEDRAKT